MSTESLWALLDPANRADPYPLYARIRAAGPVTLPQGPTTVFASHADCLAVLRHPASSADRRNSTVWRRRLEQLPAASPGQRIDYGTPSFLFLDPPDHTRLRRLVSSAFTPRIINRLRPFLTELIDDLLDGAAARGELELVADLAYPVPVAVICRLLGVPLADQARFRTWSELLARSLDPLVALTGAEDPETPTRMQAAEQLRHYIQELVAARRHSPGGDLITALIRVEESGEGLSEQEIISTCVLLLIAGHETTVNLIANGALALLREIGQWQALVDDPTRAPKVVEETLRFDPPVHVVGRVARGGLELPGGARVPDGGYALLLIAAAGRDPAVLAEPDRFDPDRPEVRNLAFGMGPHFCLGAPLARLEAQLVLGRLAQRVSSARLAADPPPYKANMALRGMSALPVHAGPLAPRTVPWV
ncbi:MAG TPA: cytochrome P450 [Pseudonocardia sp.]|jgi:cytochrome P450|uniref:cytochrome P450 n=1 Tax=Pseudonocardia sp. TaxID=60912 RepID=UPI002F3ED22F